MWFFVAFLSWILTGYLCFEIAKVRKQLNALAASAVAWCEAQHG